MAGELFTILAPLFITVAIGFGWARRGGGFDAASITPLSVNVSIPCLTFASISRLEVDPIAFGELAIAVVVAMVLFAAIATAALRAARLPIRTFLPAMTFPNVGNLGLPLCYFAFGDLGLALAMTWYVICGLGHFTFGVWIASGVGSPLVLLKSPLLYGLAAGLAFMLTDTPPPRWAINTTLLLGQLGIPLMLLMLGVQLARLRIVSLGRGIGLALLRAGMGFAVGYGVAEAFGLEGVARGVMILQAAAPVAVFNYILAERYGREPAEIAGLIVISSGLAVITLPALLLYLL